MDQLQLLERAAEKLDAAKALMICQVNAAAFAASQTRQGSQMFTTVQAQLIKKLKE